MKTILTAIVIATTIHSYSQPGPDVVFPRNMNLNEFARANQHRDEIEAQLYWRWNPIGIITIDSTSNLSHIPLLKQLDKLSLSINLPFIPEQLADFDETRELSLKINNDATDISFLNEFPNLEYLYLETTGDISFSNYVKLDSLVILEVEFSKKITSLKAFEKINSLLTISLRWLPNLLEFPEFDLQNRIWSVQLYHETRDGCENCPPSSVFIDLKNLNRLRMLEVLDLYAVNSLSEIPDDLSRKLRVLKINDSFRANTDFLIKSNISDLNPIINYPKLEELELSCIHLQKISGDYSALPLKRVSLIAVGLEDLTGLKTMKGFEKALPVREPIGAPSHIYRTLNWHN